MIRKIVEVHDPSLRKRSVAVKKIDKKIQSLVEDMKETLVAQNDPEGVGLAAPQVGKNIRLFIIDYEGFKRAIINPEVLEEKNAKTKKRSNKILEGCLSLPHFYGPLKRNPWIKIKYLDISGQEVIEEFSGFHAQIIQHEIDHLNGVLFIDRILEQKAPLYKFEGEEWEEVELI